MVCTITKKKKRNVDNDDNISLLCVCEAFVVVKEEH